MHFTASSVPHSFDRNGGLCARAARFSQEGIPVYRPGKFSLCILVKNDSRKRTRIFASMASCHRHDPTCPRDTRSFQELELYQILHGLGPLWYTFTGQATSKSCTGDPAVGHRHAPSPSHLSRSREAHNLETHNMFVRRPPTISPSHQSARISHNVLIQGF